MSDREWRRIERVREDDIAGELADELAFHASMRADSLKSAGYSAADAETEALKRLGDVEDITRLCRIEAARHRRNKRFGEMMHMTIHDLLRSARTMARHPGFALTACVTLALGIGTLTALYSMVDAVLLAPLPYRDASQVALVRVPNDKGVDMGVPRSSANVWKQGTRSMESFALYGTSQLVLTGAGDPLEIRLTTADNSFFHVLGASAALGRVFNESDKSGSIVVLSARLWRQRFASDPGIVGKRITLKGVPQTVIGVMPAAFDFPIGAGVDAWKTRPSSAPDSTFDDLPISSMIARLRPGVTTSALDTELYPALHESLTRPNDFMPAGAGKLRPHAVTATEAMTVTDSTLMLLFAAGLLLLVIASANVANLFLVRAAARQVELTVRSALGGKRSALIASLMGEAFVICVTSAMLGLALAYGLTRAIAVMNPGSIARWEAIHVSLASWGAASCALLLAALVCAVLPAVAGSRVNVAAVLRADVRASQPRQRLRLQDAIVTIEIALVFVLLIGASLLARSFVAVRGVDAGLDVDRVITARMTLGSSYSPVRRAAFYANVVQRLRALPGVDAAAIVSAIPMHDRLDDLHLAVSSATGSSPIPALGRFASDGYFKAMGTPLRGRDFDSRDTDESQPVAIINNTLAHMLFGDREPLGLTTTVGRKQYVIVGVTKDMRSDGPEAPAAPEWYGSFTQAHWLPTLVVVLRTASDPATYANRIVRTVHSIDSSLPVADVQTMSYDMSVQLARRRFDLAMLAAFAGIGLVLAAVGVFGVMSHAVAQRRRELGIRQAVGANTNDVILLVLQHALRLLIPGVGIGICAAVVFAQALRHVLFAVQPLDPPAFALGLAVISAVAIMAAAVPAAAAARMKPAAIFLR